MAQAHLATRSLDARAAARLYGQRWLVWLTGHGSGSPVRGAAWRTHNSQLSADWVFGFILPWHLGTEHPSCARFRGEHAM
jgi:hypothetical protein